VPSFVAQVKKAIRLGVLQGYRRQEDALPTVRGRIQFSEMVRRFGIVPPIDVQFDEFTEDIDENRIIKAALSRLRRMRVRDDESRRALRQFDLLFASVTDVQYHPSQIPAPMITRLNDRYEQAMALATVILQGASFELVHGGVSGRAVLFDMAKVVEDFIVEALRDALGASDRTLVQGAKGHAMLLDEERQIRLEPDISYWDGARCRFLADVKYKTADGRISEGDYYQLLAYLTAAGLGVGTLIYAGDSKVMTSSRVVRDGPVLLVHGVDLTQPAECLTSQIAHLAAGLRLATQSFPEGHLTTAIFD